tara:strand:+ start:28 stop:381 length:354 start_codon:yes stop_codon:yes gene_type:complete
MNIEVKKAIEVIENALIFYAEEGISSDKKAQKELDDAWNIVKEKKNYGYGYDDSNSIVIIWEIDDIKNIRPDLTDDECMEVLDYAERKHDATLGITYDTLEWHCDYLFPVKEEANNG